MIRHLTACAGLLVLAAALIAADVSRPVAVALVLAYARVALGARLSDLTAWRR